MEDEVHIQRRAACVARDYTEISGFLGPDIQNTARLRHRRATEYRHLRKGLVPPTSREDLSRVLSVTTSDLELFEAGILPQEEFEHIESKVRQVLPKEHFPELN